MTVQDLIDDKTFEVISIGDMPQTKITTPYCCDLLSVAMGNAPAGSAWCTVMANMNTLAVASLADTGCVILCGQAKCDENMIMRANSQGITLLRTEKPIFETALYIYKKMQECG